LRQRLKSAAILGSPVAARVWPALVCLQAGRDAQETISMPTHRTIAIVFAALLPGCVAALAQQAPLPNGTDDKTIYLNVGVAGKSGPSVSGLTQQDFTLFDNKAPRPITSFKAVSADQEHMETILLLDAVNARFTTVSYAQAEVQKFLTANGGKLAQPTALAFLTDKGLEADSSFSTDGNALSASLNNHTSRLREINRSAGFWGADERLQISLNAIHQLTSYASSLPGRKLVLWISPGWPLLSGPGIEMDTAERRKIFGDIVDFSGLLRQANVTLYDINPIGPGESVLGADYYQSFLTGIKDPGQTDLGDLGLQVLAVQSGGLVLLGTNDIAEMLQQCTADARTWYEIGFSEAPTEKPNEYHQIDIKIDKPGLKARTRTGYYAQP
jgi:VWFA-related protein